MLRVWWSVTLLLAALGLVMGGAHALELPVRIRYDPEFYTRVTRDLYRYFGMVGGPVQLLAFLAAVVLARLLRGRAAFRSTAAGAAMLGLSLALWFVLVQPVNAVWAEALRAGPAEAVAAYAELRGRWETGHVVAFVAWLLGFALLVDGPVREAARPPARG